MKNNEKQKLLIEYLVSSPDTFALCQSIIHPDYFDPEFRQSVAFITEYYTKYSAIPSIDQITAETQNVFVQRIVTKDQLAYCSTEIEQFCRKQALQKAIIAASQLISKDDTGGIEQMIRDAVSISLNRDLGTDYFDNPITRLEQMSLSPQRTPTKWREIDDLLGGGLARTEMLLVCANSGGGKSITLANLGINFLEQGLNVLYLSLELSQELISQRFDIMYTGIPSPLHQSRYQDIARELQQVSNKEGAGHLTIKWMPTGTNAIAIRGYLKEYEIKHGFVPDLLVVDYLDLMGTNQKMSSDDIWAKDKAAAEQLGDIGKFYNMFIATASQLNRAAIDADEVHQGHTAGGISKVNTVDWQIAILQNALMKSNGEIIFQFLKARSSDAVGKKALLKWDGVRLRILSFAVKDENAAFKQAIQDKQKSTFAGLPDKSKTSILDIMDF